MTNTNPNTPLGCSLPTRASAFVVHLDLADASDSREASGRVEHVESGRTGRFESLAGLLAFMRQTLAERSRALIQDS